MELVDGDTLQELIARGVPADDALEMAAQVADALEEAHEQGIIHRDLKPANIKVTPGGQVKVLDFGLAKALGTGTDQDPNQSPLSMSPTLTAQMTQAGVLLGTAAYMSPEQDASSPEISPNGRWIAYQSPGSGAASVYVRPVQGEGKWQISPTGGSYPCWTADGRELLYIDTLKPTRPLMTVDIAPGETFRAGPPRVLFEDTSRFTTATSPMKNWDALPTGDLFAFIELARDESARAPIEVLLSWTNQPSGEGN